MRRRGRPAWPTDERAVLSSVRTARLVCIALGILFAGAAVQRIASRDAQATVIGSRMDGLRETLASLGQGGPSLLGYPSAPADDQGLFVYVPLLDRSLGAGTPLDGLRWLTYGLYAALFLVYPLIFYELFGSLLAAAVAPSVTLVQLVGGAGADVYWLSQWAILACVPAVLVVYRRWSARAVLPLALLVFVAGFATTMRSSAGLPVLGAALGVVLLRERRWGVRASLAGLLVVSYLALPAFAFGGLRAERDAYVGKPLSKTYLPSHPFWHSAYIGLGYVENDRGIWWNDGAGFAAARRVDPHVVVLTRRYDHVLRHVYFQTVRAEPGLALRSYTAKLGVLVAHVLDRFRLLPALLLVAVVAGSRRFRRYVLLVVPSVAFGLASPLVGVPVAQYERGWVAAAGLLWTLGLCWLVSEGPGRFRALLAQEAARRRFLAVAGVAAVAALLGLTGWLGFVRSRFDSDYYRRSEARLTDARLGRTTQAWSFSGRLPRGWSVVPRAAVSPDAGALDVRTGTPPQGYALTSPPLQLEPGSYHAVFDGRIVSGGLVLGVLNPLANRWVATSLHSHLQTGRERGRVDTAFDVVLPVPLRIVLTNWTRKPAVSRWQVRKVVIARAARQS